MAVTWDGKEKVKMTRMLYLDEREKPRIGLIFPYEDKGQYFSARGKGEEVVDNKNKVRLITGMAGLKVLTLEVEASEINESNVDLVHVGDKELTIKEFFDQFGKYKALAKLISHKTNP